MLPESIKALENKGCTVVQARYIVIEDENGDRNGVGEDGLPIVNKDKEGKIRDTFCVLPRSASVKVFTGSSRYECEVKISRDEPDIKQEKRK
jgi:hypothetical protein